MLPLMKPSAPAVLSFALLTALCASALAVDPPTDEQLRAQHEEQTNAKTRALWEKLTPQDRDAVSKFLQESENVRIFKPDIVAYLAQGRRREAIKLVVDNYHLDEQRAGVVVDLIGYANGVE